MNNKKKFEQMVEQLSEENIKILSDIAASFNENDAQNQNDYQKKQSSKKHSWLKPAIASFACLIILFTALFGGVVFSKDFRHMVFNALEGDGKMIISSEMADLWISEEDIADVMRPTALDGQGYTIRADGDFSKNYTLTYSKSGRKITFDVRRGEAQLFLDTDWTGWEASEINGSPVYIAADEDGCPVLEILLQNELKCSISGYLSHNQLLDLAKSIATRASGSQN